MNIIGIYIDNVDSKEITSTYWPIFANTIRTIYSKVE